MSPSPRHHRHHARRSRNEGLPGWAWLIIGAALALGVMLLVQNQFKSNGDADFFRASTNTSNANTSSQPAISALEESPSLPTPASSPAASNPASTDSVSSEGNVNISAVRPEQPAPADPPNEVVYDFYTVLSEPGGTDIDAAELATPRTESVAATTTSRQSSTPQPGRPASTPGTSSRTRPASPPARPTTPTAATTARSVPPSTANTSATAPHEQPVLLQAGAFLAPGDAEALKARIALLGLHARVESGAVDDQTVYRVRLGPYTNPRELADAKQRLDDGGLSSREIRGP